jgi:hypothetical protein
MSADLVPIVLNKISTIYTEQIWAVTISSALSGFVIVQRECLVETIGYEKLRLGVIGNAVLCSIFIAIRFFAYIKYDKLLDSKLLPTINTPITNPFFETIALLSGTVFYFSIVISLCWATLKVIKKENIKNNHCCRKQDNIEIRKPIL